MTASTRKPLLVVADDDPADRARVLDELSRRYSGDYAVGGCTIDELEKTLDQAQAEGDDVAVCLAAGERGAQLLAGVRARFPAARRGLLIPWLGWADHALGELVLRAMARGWIDLYVLRPAQTPDEVFHRTISELLQESARLKGQGPAGAKVVADPRSRRASRAAVDPGRAGHPATLSSHRRKTPRRRSRSQTARCSLTPRRPSSHRPAASRSSSRRTTPISSSSAPVRPDWAPRCTGPRRASRRPCSTGAASEGQRGLELPDPQLPRLPARARRRRTRPARVPAGVALRHPIAGRSPSRCARARRARIRCAHSGRRSGVLRLEPSVLALGVEYRRLDAPGCVDLEGAGIYYGASMSEAQAFAGEDVYVVGGGNSAGQAALHLARYADRVVGSSFARDRSLRACPSI